MNLNDFDYFLPSELIAQNPLADRSASRLLLLNINSKTISHNIFSNLIDYLDPKDLLVFNNTKVLPARVFVKKESGGKSEVLIERVIGQNSILAQIKSSKSLTIGSKLLIDNDCFFKIVEKKANFFVLTLNADKPIIEFLEEHGKVPLPPYIKRLPENNDKNRYQTVFAEKLGAVAAPTAGLHFDASLLEKIKIKNIATTCITLHVGAGTFQPVRVSQIEQHQMHAEQIEVSAEVCEKIRVTKQKGGRVIAVGTTTVRALESAAAQNKLKPFAGETRIFIYPGYCFRVVDALITNFHLPKSTLLMLVCAFAGRENVFHAYAEAIKERYRFFSYGDAMFITQ